MTVDRIAVFRALAAEMNARPERFRLYGDADVDCIIVMERNASQSFAVRVVIDGIRCDHVEECAPDEPADFRLVGPLEAWETMFADIVAHGHATGLQTLNSLALLGEEIRCVGHDPMGLDKFSRFNQTLQELFDGASRVLAMPAMEVAR
jgi:hypothetical protein